MVTRFNEYRLTMDEVKLMERRPKVGLALSSGAVKGLAHLGVLQVFEEEGIPIDFIAGTSAGSLVGGLYACGQELKYLKQLACSIKWEHISEVTIPKKGLILGNRFLDFLKVMTQNKTFDQVNIPFAAIATDIRTGEAVLMNDGLVAEAIRASTSIPGIYAPFQRNGQMLVDGAVVDRIPITTVRKMGADLVIAVDVGFGIGSAKLSNIFEILIQASDIMQREICKHCWPQADVLIEPAVSQFSGMDLRKANELMEAGMEATRAKIPEIKNLLTGVGGS